ncbi:hypothetical protein LCGC14_2382290 [marine sediment metagenome]|uniref:DUF1385 domain-containing protein n=1 Tax=marine sediment metagenome TaxID=412755 RepID=A0A0F9EVD0_9ZZZZ
MDKKRNSLDTDSTTDTTRKKFQVGGQAVIEGVMMRSPKSFTIAVRKSDGQIVIKKRPYIALTERFRFLKIPIIRGAVVLIESLYLGIKALSFSAEEAMDEENPETKTFGSKQEKKQGIFVTLWLILSLLMGFALALFIFFYLPLVLVELTGVKGGFLFNLIDGLIRIMGFALALFIFFYLPLVLVELTGVKGGFLFNLIDGLIRISFFLIYIWAISLWKSMRRVFQYHGAEHKSIFTFEAGEELTLKNTQKYSTRHPGCGTSFLLIVMVISILVFMFCFSC